MNWDMRAIPPKTVTLPRVAGGEEGRGYTTIVFEHEADDRGEHMRLKIKRRKVRRELA